ncbi:hypothetical protein ABZW11_36895 [Nonomuraea sp. NPDC004580]|uniref:hypothetical protein n=1 Tax=Nonomuraea sp. NPDC004580 TaxID=3154552 RepID=UPI0033A2E148
MATVALVLPLVLVGCQESASSSAKYSTGGDPTDDPCAREAHHGPPVQERRPQGNARWRC